MHLKIHDSPGESTVTAVCDAELIGRTLKGEFCDLEIDKAFYGSDTASEEEVLEALQSAVNANIIGKKVCSLAVRAGLIEEADCTIIEGIPHAQIYRI